MKPDYTRIYSYDEAIQGMGGNVSEQELDEQFRLFNQYARYLKTRPENLVLYAASDQEDPTVAVFKDNLIPIKEKEFKNSVGKSVGMSLGDIKFIRQCYDNVCWLDFKSQEDLNQYIGLIEDYE